MGVFYHIHAVALAEDLPGLEEEHAKLEDFYAAVDRGYTQVRCYKLWLKFTVITSAVDN